MTFVLPIMNYLTIAIGVVGGIVGVVAFADAVTRRTDAYPAADKQTKTTWLAITGISGVVLVLGMIPGSLLRAPSLLWLAGLVGVLVYLCDVRPRLREVSGGSSHW